MVENDWNVIYEALCCVKICIETGLRSFIMTDNVINVIVLNIDSQSDKVQRLTLELLTILADVPLVGQGQVFLKFWRENNFLYIDW